MIHRACRKTRVIENEFGVCALLDQFELHTRKDTSFPTDFAPRRHHSCVRCEFDVPAYDVTAEKRERASYLTANVSWFLPVGHAGFTELDDSIELPRVCQGVITAVLTRSKNDLLMNRVCRVRYSIVVGKQRAWDSACANRSSSAQHRKDRGETQKKIAATKKC